MERALIVGVDTKDKMNYDYSVEELKALAKACEYEVAGVVTQCLDHPVSATYIGSGKVEKIIELIEPMEIDCLIFEDTLSPVQLKNLQHRIHAHIIDRTGLILEIFSKRAKTREAKLQVESANLAYMMPRLIGMWEAIGRQGGTSGSKSNKGIGETQLELDRRWIQKRISELRRELDAIEHDRDIKRRRREKGSLPLVALVGYTNAGKSTIMNHLISKSLTSKEEKRVFEEDMLFATLDTSVRRIDVGNKKDFLLSDTVGFLDNLPHTLIKAFRSTLDEIKYADLLLIVVDLSDEHHLEQMMVTNDTLQEIGVTDIPCIYVMNKVDKCSEDIDYPVIRGDKIYLSAREDKGIDELISFIQETVYKDNRIARFLIPYDKGKLVNEINEEAMIIKQEYVENGVRIEADVPKHLLGRLAEYLDIV